jgi:hypothetical protein
MVAANRLVKMAMSSPALRATAAWKLAVEVRLAAMESSQA